MFYRAIPFRESSFAIRAAPGLHGLLEFVGARWRRRDQCYIASRAQRRAAELLIDAGFIGESQTGRYLYDPDYDDQVYHPGTGETVYDRREAVELAKLILNAPPPRPRNHPELPL